MKFLEQQPIPEWLYKEVEDYFIPLDFEPKTIADIGANIGAFSQRAHQRWPAAKFYCYEPMPFNVYHLRRNAPAGAIIFSAAVRARSGIDDIFIGDMFVTSGFVQLGRQTQNQIMVECIAASSVPSCELVKIDTEGCEVEILKNLDLTSTRAVLLEHHSRADAETIKKFLNDRYALIGGDSGQPVGTLRFIGK